MTAPRKLNVARMRKRTHAAPPAEPAFDEPDEETNRVIRDMTGEVIRVIPHRTPAA